MKLSAKIEVKAAKEQIWPYYANPDLRGVWEEDLESLTFDGAVATGTTGKMKLAGMPEMAFTLTEVIPNQSYCDRTDVPGMGSLYFGHQILEEAGKIWIEHSVCLEKADFSEADLGFLAGVFSDVPKSILIIKEKVEQ